MLETWIPHEDLDYKDEDALDLTAAQYASAYPGLLGSYYYHGDVNNDLQVNGYDADALAWLVDNGCVYCMEGFQFENCYSDLNENGTDDLADLATLLAHYGMTTGATRDDGDVEGDDGDVDILDLAQLLGVYGNACDCFVSDGEGLCGEGDESEGTGYVDVTIAAIDTNGHTGGGFVGEVDHFVFDMQIEVDDPNSDDWVVSGAVLEAENDAEFRLSSSAQWPDQYASFVAAPWTTLPVSSTCTLAGAYDPPDPNEVFTTGAINLGWFDGASSNDGPATVMRIVIDVSDVDGADVSTGFGSVYFSQSGPVGKDDILVATLASETATAESAPGMTTLTGNFYVKGE